MSNKFTIIEKKNKKQLSEKKRSPQRGIEPGPPAPKSNVLTSGVSIIADVAESIAETEPISINRIKI